MEIFVSLPNLLLSKELQGSTQKPAFRARNLQMYCLGHPLNRAFRRDFSGHLRPTVPWPCESPCISMHRIFRVCVDPRPYSGIPPQGRPSPAVPLSNIFQQARIGSPPSLCQSPCKPDNSPPPLRRSACRYVPFLWRFVWDTWRRYFVRSG